ncbi:MAG: carbohydrate kinase family protein [Chloroflexi bacterium]|nr:carbohydrate kinase family protein [Chloroflexota bacterium]
MDSSSPSFLILGQLRREYLITPAGKVHLDQPGGNLLYAASGLTLWGENPGLVARVGEDYPRSWLEQFRDHGLNTNGVQILEDAYDLRSFIAYTDLNTRFTDDPITHFSRLEMSFPKALLSYKDPNTVIDERIKLTPISLRQSDLPEDYLYSSAAHLCPLDYLTHSLLPAFLRQTGLTAITLDPASNYMNFNAWDDVMALLPGLTAFLSSEEKIRALFERRSDDLWEMAEALASYGCPIIVIKRGAEGQMLYDAESQTKYILPAYPARVVDPTGAGDAFCGGFLAGYRHTFDPLQAGLHGNVSASLTVEGSGAFYSLQTLPGLQLARLETLPDAVRKA